MCHTKYTVTVKTQNQKEIKAAVFGSKEYLLAKKDSYYSVCLHNDSDDVCDVSLTISNTFVGTWVLKSHTKVTLSMCKKTSKRFCFDNTFYHINDLKLHEDVYENSSIAAVFVPAREVVSKCFANMETNDVSCKQEVNWSKVVVVKIPVLLCEHHM